MSNLINIRTSRRVFGQTNAVHEAMRRIGVTAIGARGEKLYDREKLELEVNRLIVSGWRLGKRPSNYHTRRSQSLELGDGRWAPDHPGQWTLDDIAEFNRLHPFRREYVAGLVDMWSGSAGARTSKCRWK